MACHAGDAVIEHDGRNRRTVVLRGEDSSDAGMEERGVTKNGADAPLETGLLHAGGVSDGCTHADGRIHRIKRRERAERIAADIASDRCTKLVERVEYAAVSASGAEHGWARRKRLRRSLQSLRHGDILENLMTESLNTIRIEFEHVHFRLMLDNLDTHCTDLLLKERIKFLDDEQTVHALREGRDKIARERIRPAELQHGEFRECLLHVLIGDAGGRDAERGVALLDAVELRFRGSLGHGLGALLSVEAVSTGEHRHRDRLGDVLLVGNQRMRGGIELAELH